MINRSTLWPAVLLVISLFTHLIFFGHPDSVVFDETYSGQFNQNYAKGEYYFDVHPPLARLLTKGFSDILDVRQDSNFSNIGNHLTDDVLYLRILPLIAGILLPLIVYFICRRLGISDFISFVVGFLLCIENSLIVQSRFILFDSILMFFGFTGLLLYLTYIKDESKKYFLLVSAGFITASFSIKWTGLAFLLLIFLFEIFRNFKSDIKKIFKVFLVYLVVGLVFYFSVFAIHFSLLKNPGPGDAFMTSDFQQHSLVTKFIELNKEMYRANATLTNPHQYSSTWYSWPLMKRPIFYWQDVDREQYIYLLGNPFIYWLGSLSVILLVFSRFFKKINNKTTLFILVGFLVNFLPFMFIGRVMFLYHYQSALVFTVIAIGYIIDTIKIDTIKIVSSFMIVFACLIAFFYFSPLTYGLYLNESQLMNRMWFSTWR